MLSLRGAGACAVSRVDKRCEEARGEAAAAQRVYAAHHGVCRESSVVAFSCSRAAETCASAMPPSRCASVTPAVAVFLSSPETRSIAITRSARAFLARPHQVGGASFEVARRGSRDERRRSEPRRAIEEKRASNDDGQRC